MKVRELIELLSREDPEAKVHLYTGWEGLDHMEPEAIRAYPQGYLTPGPSAVCIFYSDPGERAEPSFVGNR